MGALPWTAEEGADAACRCGETGGAEGGCCASLPRDGDGAIGVAAQAGKAALAAATASFVS